MRLIYNLLNNSFFSIGFFNLFSFLVPLNIVFITKISSFGFTSWRAEKFVNSELNLVLMYVLVNDVILHLLSHFRLKNQTIKNITIKPVINSKRMFFILSSLALLIWFYLTFGISRDQYVDVNNGDGFLININFILLSLLYIDSLQRKGTERIIFSGLIFSIGVLYAVAGYRMILIILILIFFSEYFKDSKAKIRSHLKYIPLVAFVYLLLIIIAETRKMGNVFDLDIYTIFSRSNILLIVSEYQSAHEQILFYSLYEAFESGHFNYGGYYLDSIIRVLPKEFYSLFDSPLRINDVIKAKFAPPEFSSNNLNLGAYYLTESFLNFGAIGLITVNIFSFYFFYWIEKIKYYSNRNYYLYLFIVSLIPSFVYYGLNAFLKPLVYFWIIYLIIVLLRKNKSFT